MKNIKIIMPELILMLMVLFTMLLITLEVAESRIAAVVTGLCVMYYSVYNIVMTLKKK